MNIFRKKIYKIVYKYSGYEYDMIIEAYSAAQATKKFNKEMRGYYKIISFDEFNVGRG